MEKKGNPNLKLNNGGSENSANSEHAMILSHRHDLPRTSANSHSDRNSGIFVKVPKIDLENLVAEVMQLKAFLPKIVADDQRCLNHFPSGNNAATNYQQLYENLRMENENLRSKYDQLQEEVKAQKVENDRLQGNLTQMNEELSQQLEYCANMGASMGTMLWKLSKDEQCVQSMLVGVRTEEFLRLVAQTIDSFIATYSDKSLAMPSEICDESEYILSLCGIVTNMAATPDGRDYLISSESGREVFEAFFTVLCAAPNNKLSTKLRNLILMAVYNMSINQRGLRYVSSRDAILPLIANLLKEESDPETKYNTLRLLQSLAIEPESPEFTEMLQATIPLSLIHKFIDDPSPEVKMAARELLSDVKTIYYK